MDPVCNKCFVHICNEMSSVMTMTSQQEYHAMGFFYWAHCPKITSWIPLCCHKRESVWTLFISHIEEDSGVLLNHAESEWNGNVIG